MSDAQTEQQTHEQKNTLRRKTLQKAAVEADTKQTSQIEMFQNGAVVESNSKNTEERSDRHKENYNIYAVSKGQLEPKLP